VTSWELVKKTETESSDGTLTDALERIRVPGGWLYRSSRIWVGEGEGEGGDALSESMVFVPVATA